MGRLARYDHVALNLDSSMSQSDRVQISVYFPKEIYDSLVAWAEEDDRAISNLVVRIVSKAVEEHQQQKGSSTNQGQR